ncbi:MAG: HD-GYP domain-containing protein [Gammaproteobacteria bacterium]|nr:HD-GYP domain-containing protein [Gammaproteobacteria bacterium]
MLKKVPVDQLRLGMFLNELCGSWMDHPFWTTRFMLKDPDDLDRLRTSGVREAWIDTSRGLDVEPTDGDTAAGETAAEARARNEQELLTKAVAQPDSRTDLQAELQRASRICSRGKTAVVSMFQEARMGRAVETRALEPLVEEISASVMRNPSALISLARLKTADDYTYMHSVAVCALMIALARQLGLDQAQTREAGVAGLIHDLGKAVIPLEILNKPGKLTDDEFARIKTHPVEGHRMLSEAGGAGEMSLDVCLHHHEKVDGGGYPDRLSGEAISLYAKMGAVCDVYDAITSNRPYKAGWDPGEAIRKMNEWSTGHFDNRVFQAFVKSVGIYPIGSLVRLESGRLAVVTELIEGSLLTPKVKQFYCTRTGARIAIREIDLTRPEVHERIVSWESPERWGFTDLDELWNSEPTRH